MKRNEEYLSAISCVHAQSCLTLCDPMDCSPPGSFVHGIFLARTLESVAISSSRGSSWPRDLTRISCVSCIEQTDSLPTAPLGSHLNSRYYTNAYKRHSLSVRLWKVGVFENNSQCLPYGLLFSKNFMY